ncbi:hypothetical protein V5H53_06015 [Helicobacter pylori]
MKQYPSVSVKLIGFKGLASFDPNSLNGSIVICPTTRDNRY